MPSIASDRIFDVIVVGLGAIGGATLYQLARRGVRVAGIDRFAPPHAQGSSHGQTRITREAIGEGEHYSPFVLRSNRIWEEAEQELGEALLERCGFLFITRDDGGTSHHGRPGFMAATRHAAEIHGIAHEMLDHGELRRRFPQFTGLAGDESAYFEPGGGYLRAEACIAAQLTLARRHGARIVTDLGVDRLVQEGDAVRVSTADGDLLASKVIVTAGAWVPRFADPAMAGRLRVARQVLHWFTLGDPSAWHPSRSPTFIWTHGLRSEEQFYGFPPVDGEVKVAQENLGEDIDPDALGDPAIDVAGDVAGMLGHVTGRLAGIAGRPIRSERCIYTLTPDQDFLIGDHAAQDRIRIVSACSGHGFKHAAAIGETLAAEWAGGGNGLTLDMFAPTRFGSR